MSTIGPDFSKVSTTQKANYSHFFEQTNASNIKSFASGTNLTKLIRSANNVILVIDECNPIWTAHDTTEIQARQWQIDNISEVKKLVAKTIVLDILLSLKEEDSLATS